MIESRQSAPVGAMAKIGQSKWKDLPLQTGNQDAFVKQSGQSTALVRQSHGLWSLL